jgi:hypothetical protein
MVDWFIGIMSAPLNESYGLLGHIAANCLAGGGVGEAQICRHMPEKHALHALSSRCIQRLLLLDASRGCFF